MTGLVALGYLSAVGLLVGAIAVRLDPRVTARLASLSPNGPRERAGGRATVGRVIGALGRRIPLRRLRRSLNEGSAALPEDPAAVDRVLGWKVVLAVAGGVLGLSLTGGILPGLAAAVVIAAAGFRLPDFLLARQARVHRTAMASSVPDLLDLVAVAVTAGLTPRLALERAVEEAHGPLARELSSARRQVALGAPWRRALWDAARRTQLRDLHRLAVTLERSERLGTPVAEQLRSLAADVRSARRAAAEERARRAPVLMLFPLVFLILPAFVLAAVVPAIVVATRGIP